MSQKNNNRPVYQQQEQQQQYFEQTLSEECHSSEEFNYEEYTSTGGGAPAPAYPPVSAPRNVPHSMSGGQRQYQRPQTATQYSPQERRYSGSPPAAGPPPTARHYHYPHPHSPPQQRSAPFRAFGGRPQTAAPQRYSAAEYANPRQPEHLAPQHYASYQQYARTTPAAGRQVPIQHVQQHPAAAASSPPNAPQQAHPPPQMNRSSTAAGSVPQYLRHRIALNRQQQAETPRLASDNISTAYEEIRTSTAAQKIAADYLPATFGAAGDLGNLLDSTLPQPKTTSAAAATTCPEAAAATARATHSQTASSLSSTDSCVPQVCSAASSAQLPIFSQIIDQAVGLEKSKKMIVRLIDTAILGLRTKGTAQSKQSLASSQLAGGDATTAAAANVLSTEQMLKPNPAQQAAMSRSMKRECIRKIEDELERLKQLEEFGDASTAASAAGAAAAGSL